jgi:predicted transposase/invertase (TIGR01784 family)
MKTNNKFKNSVFTLLFSDPALLRELYCALGGVTLPQDAPVSINTLEDVLFMDFINDISFEIGGKLVVLIEHQSTINPNMALRLLMYIGRVYEKIVDNDALYSKKRVPIPQPEFFVLYNGTDPFPDQEISRLSDSFEKLKGLGIAEKDFPALELTVHVININEGRNAGIAARCKKLSEYSAFVAKVREFEKELGSREEAIKKAVKYCQSHDILKEFLELHAGEVLSMLMTEWNWDDALAVRYEEGHEDGWEEGREDGLEEGRANEKLEIARNLLSEGSTPEFVQKITGLDMDTIEGLRAGL